MREYITAKSKRGTVNACWLWKLSLDKDGYGRGCWGKRSGRAHRLSYEAFVGPIPDGMVIDHLCRNRACVNPEHLEPVTVGENSHRGVLYPSMVGIRGCAKHGFDDGRIGTSINRGKRYRRWQCRPCNRAARARINARRAAA